MEHRMQEWVERESQFLARELGVHHARDVEHKLREDTRIGPEAFRALVNQTAALDSQFPSGDHIIMNNAQDGGQDLRIQHLDRDRGMWEQTNVVAHFMPTPQFDPRYRQPEYAANYPPVVLPDQTGQQAPMVPSDQVVPVAPSGPPPGSNPNEVGCTVAGAAAGGVLGNVIGDRRNRAGTTILGAVAGALVGNKVCDH